MSNAELQQLAAQLAPDYDATNAMHDLQMMQFMLQSGRDELALTCVNRVNAYLFKLAKLGAVVIDNGAQFDGIPLPDFGDKFGPNNGFPITTEK